MQEDDNEGMGFGLGDDGDVATLAGVLRLRSILSQGQVFMSEFPNLSSLKP